MFLVQKKKEMLTYLCARVELHVCCFSVSVTVSRLSRLLTFYSSDCSNGGNQMQHLWSKADLKGTICSIILIRNQPPPPRASLLCGIYLQLLVLFYPLQH